MDGTAPVLGAAKELLRFPARVALGAIGLLERALWHDLCLRYRPVFVIGVPRSGTTLLHQVITYALATSYFTNLALRLRVQGLGRPPATFAAWLGAALNLPRSRPEPFQSAHGMTRGWGNPSDSVMMWQHWFPNCYVDAGELTLDAQNAAYQAVAGTERLYGKPFVDKCTHNSVRILALAEVFPTALYVQCTRNPLAVAQSLYLASTRPGLGAPQERWESVRPRGFECLWQVGMVERVCGQVYGVEQDIRDGLAVVSPDRILRVQYRDLCGGPQRLVEDVAAFMARMGSPARQARALPEQFPFQHVRRTDPATYSALVERLEHLYGRRMERLDEPP